MTVDPSRFELLKFITDASSPSNLAKISSEMAATKELKKATSKTSKTLTGLIKKYYPELVTGEDESEEEQDCTTSWVCLLTFLTDSDGELKTLYSRFAGEDKDKQFSDFLVPYYKSLKLIGLAAMVDGAKNSSAGSKLSKINKIFKQIFVDEPFNSGLEGSDPFLVPTASYYLSLTKQEKKEIAPVLGKRKGQLDRDQFVHSFTDVVKTTYAIMNSADERYERWVKAGKPKPTGLKQVVVMYGTVLETTTGARKVESLRSTFTSPEQFRQENEMEENEPDYLGTKYSNDEKKAQMYTYREMSQHNDDEALVAFKAKYLLVQEGVAKDPDRRINFYVQEGDPRWVAGVRYVWKVSPILTLKEIQRSQSRMRDLALAFKPNVMDSSFYEAGQWLNSPEWKSVFDTYYPEDARKYREQNLSFGSHHFRSLYIGLAWHVLSTNNVLLFNGKSQNKLMIQRALLGHVKGGSAIESYLNIEITGGEIEDSAGAKTKLLTMETSNLLQLLFAKVESMEEKFEEMMERMIETDIRLPSPKKLEGAKRRAESMKHTKEQREAALQKIEKIHDDWRKSNPGKPMPPEEHEKRYRDSVQYIEDLQLPVTIGYLKATGLGSNTATKKWSGRKRKQRPPEEEQIQHNDNEPKEQLPEEYKTKKNKKMRRDSGVGGEKVDNFDNLNDF